MAIAAHVSTERTRGGRLSSKTAVLVVVNQAGGLHIGVANGASDKVEATPFEVFTHGVGFGRSDRKLFKRSKASADFLGLGELPNVAIESPEFLLHSQEGFCILDG